MDKKAQIVITDFFVAFGLFILLAILVSIFLNIYQVNLNNTLEYNNMLVKATHAAETLTRTEGYPTNWTNLTVIVPGLVETDRNLSFYKMDMLFNTPIRTLKNAFKIRQYNMSIELYYTNGTNIRSMSDIGVFKRSAVARGYMLYESNETYVEIRVVR